MSGAILFGRGAVESAGDPPEALCERGGTYACNLDVGAEDWSEEDLFRMRPPDKPGFGWVVACGSSATGRMILTLSMGSLSDQIACVNEDL